MSNKSIFMKKLSLRLLALAALAALSAGAVCRAQANQPVQDITVTTSFYTVSITITGDAQLTAMANKAFQAHGRYDRHVSGGAYTINFTTVSPTQVRVDVTAKNGASVLSQVSTAATLREALYHAADAAVAATGGGRGFFSARLAFVSNRSGSDAIYVSDLFMDDVRPYAIGPANRHYSVMIPRWSPDGSKLIFTSDFRGENDIYQLDVNASRWTQFLSLVGTNMSARYSPDGANVVAVLSGRSGQQSICLLSAAGQSTPTVLTRSNDVLASPCFSPDGRQIVYQGDTVPRLYLMPASGGSPKLLSTGMTSCTEPDWSSANPNLIAFTTRVGREFRIAVYDMSTRRARVIPVKGLSGDLMEPSWLPDGRHLVCTWRAANQRAIYILDTLEKKDDAAGNRATRISAGYAEHPSVWSR